MFLASIITFILPYVAVSKWNFKLLEKTLLGWSVMGIKSIFGSILGVETHCNILSMLVLILYMIILKNLALISTILLGIYQPP